MRQVLQLLRQHKLYAKKSKCTFFTPQIEYLGFIVSQDGISVDPAKVKDIVEWPQPTTVTETRGFLGITGWYRTFIQNYALIAAPLTNLLKKGSKINWESQHQESFDKLKGHVTTAPCLKLPDFSQPFEVVTDASGIAVGGVLVQEKRPVAFTSRKLRVHEKNYPTHDLELLAVIHALKLWRHYLLGHKFQLVTDHQSLKWIFTQTTLNMRQRRWVELLQEYDFNILYRPGKDNVVADSLSRKSSLNAISIPNNPIISMVREASVKDLDYQKLLTLVLAREATGIPHPAAVNFSCDSGCLYYRERLCIPKDPNLKKAILYEAHDSPTSGHPGYAKTLNAVRKSYHWIGLKGDILRYVRQCLSCQRIKAERVKMPGKLQPLDIPQMKWECISMDFITGLPSAQGGYNSIMVIVDMLTKISHLIPVKVTYTSSDIARIFIKEIF